MWKKGSFLIVGLLVCMVMLAGCSDGGNTISKDEFNKISNGMTYSEVCDIIGGDGELLADSGTGSYRASIYQWKGEGSVGANANITFQNGKVQSKAQIGLK